MHRPLSVVFSDSEAIEIALSIHAVPLARVLDCTYNKGKMWQGVDQIVDDNQRFSLIKTDIDQSLADSGYLDLVLDCNKLHEAFPINSFDMIVYDPPHQSDSGHGLTGDGAWAANYGTGTGKVKGNSISWMYPPFLFSAAQVLSPGGIILAKISDQTHGDEYQPQAFELIRESSFHGLRLCDLMIKIRSASLRRARTGKFSGSMNDPKWKNVLHARKDHTFFVVLRKDKICHRRIRKVKDVKGIS